MAYIGNFPAEKYTTFSKQTFTPDGSTTSFTLDFSVANENDLELFVNNVRQEPGSGKAYTATGLTLTMSSAPGASDDMYAIFQGKAQQTVTPGPQTVTGSMLATDIAISTTGNITATGLTVDGNASIGTNTIGLLSVKGGSTTSPQIRFFDGGTAKARIGVPTGTSYLSLSGSDTLTADVVVNSSGNVGIGTSSPSTKLHLSDATPTIRLQDSDGTDQYATIKQDGANLKIMSRNNTGSSGVLIRRDVGGTETDAFQLQSNGDISFYNSAGSSQDLFWDASASRLGIGTSSPECNLHVQGVQLKVKNSTSAFITIEAGSASYQSILEFSDGGGSGAFIYDHPSNYLATKVNGSEAMRIDSSGNVLIGKTSDAFADVGVVLSDSQANAFTRSGANVISVRRNTNDGDLVSFYKDTTLQGSIGSSSGNYLTIGNYINNRLRFVGSDIRPCNNDASDRDNAIDLGDANARFKDGYFGGTVTANAFSGSGLGKVLQVLQGQNATQISTTTHNSNFDIASISITPSSTSSKILILGVVMGIQGNNNSSNTRFDAKIFRGTTALNSSGANFWTFNTDYWREGGFAIHWLDSPSTTSATTYYLKGAWLDPNGGTVYVNKDGNSGYSTITVMEIAG